MDLPRRKFCLSQTNRIQKTIPHDRAREFDEASEASLARLGLNRLFPDFWAAQARSPESLAGPDLVLYFEDHQAVLIRADEKAREMIAHKVERGYTPGPHEDQAER